MATLPLVLPFAGSTAARAQSPGTPPVAEPGAAGWQPWLVPSVPAVLEHFFPGGAVTDALGQSVSYAAAAEQAAVSRLYGGIHFRSDNDAGLVGGRSVASLVTRRAQSDGAE